MATFYYRNAPETTGDWNSLGNWWMAYNAGTDTLSVPATSLPGAADDVVLLGTGYGHVSVNTGPVPTVRNVTVRSGTLSIGIVATGLITVEVNASIDSDTFDYNVSQSNFVITGNVDVYGYLFWQGVGESIVGDVTVREFGQVWGHPPITGRLTLTSYSEYKYGGQYVTGGISFYDVARWSATSNYPYSNDITFNDESYVDFGAVITEANSVTFNGSSSNYGAIGDSTYHSATITFNGNSRNMGTVTSWDSAVIFNHNAANGGAVDGSATFNHNSRNFYIDSLSWPPITSYGRVYDTFTLLPSHVAALQDAIVSIGSNGPISYRGENGINGSSILGLA